MNPPSPERQKTENALIAAVQLVSGPRVADNLAAAAHGVAEAAAQGARIVALPEYFPIMGMAEGDKVKVREADGHGPIQEFLAATAKQHGIWLIGGSIPLEAKDAAKVMNSTVVYDPAGQRVARYDKIHLFGFQKGLERYDEAASIEAGSEPVAFDTPYGRIGLSICYDLRFPELYRQHAALGADILLVPAAFTHTTGQAHWEVLLRARAIENQCWLLAAAQGGKHPNGRQTWGQSMVVDPWGQIVAQQEQAGPGISYAVLELSFLQQVRQRLPALEHRCL